MKKRCLIISLLFAGILLSSPLCCFAGTETVTGKLVLYEYDEYPYVIEVKGEKPIALHLDVDKNNRNKSVDKLLGKLVRVTGPARVITEMTELHGLKIIDVRPGKGTIFLLR